MWCSNVCRWAGGTMSLVSKTSGLRKDWVDFIHTNHMCFPRLTRSEFIFWVVIYLSLKVTLVMMASVSKEFKVKRAWGIEWSCLCSLKDEEVEDHEDQVVSREDKNDTDGTVNNNNNNRRKVRNCTIGFQLTISIRVNPVLSVMLTPPLSHFIALLCVSLSDYLPSSRRTSASV